jgi:predicted ATPase
LLQERRRALHARIVEATEKLYSDRLGEHIERVAHHALRGELWEKAAEFLHQAGNKAIAHSALPEAIAYLNQALQTLEHLQDSRRRIERAIEIRVDLGPVLIATKGFTSREVEENYSRARVLCDQFGDTPQLFPVLWGLARVHDTRGELKVGHQLGEQLLDLAERLQEPALLLEAHHELWANLSALGDLPSAWSHIEQGFLLYDPHKHRQQASRYGGHDPGVCCGYHAAEVLWLLGYPDQALRRSLDSLSLARQLSHPSTMSFALNWAVWFRVHRGEAPAVEALVTESDTLVTEQGFARLLVQVAFLKGWLLVEQGHQEAGIAEMLKVLGGSQARGTSVRWNGLCSALLAAAFMKSGQTVEGLNVVTEALRSAIQTDCRPYEAELHRIKGELLLAQARENDQQGEACFRNALKVAREQSAKTLELRATMSMSRLWQKQGKREEARALLGAVYAWFTEGFDTADLKAAKALLDEL